MIPKDADWRLYADGKAVMEEDGDAKAAWPARFLHAGARRSSARSFSMTGMALDPVPRYVVAQNHLVEPTPQILVLDQFFAAVFQPRFPWWIHSVIPFWT